MDEEQIKLLKRALELYEFTIQQRRTDNYDVWEMNDFFYMRQKLSEIIGVDVT